MSVLAAQEVGNIDGVLVGRVAAIGKDVRTLGRGRYRSMCRMRGMRGREGMTYLEDLRSAAKDVADDEDGCRGIQGAGLIF